MFQVLSILCRNNCHVHNRRGSQGVRALSTVQRLTSLCLAHNNGRFIYSSHVSKLAESSSCVLDNFVNSRGPTAPLWAHDHPCGVRKMLKAKYPDACPHGMSTIREEGDFQCDLSNIAPFVPSTASVLQSSSHQPWKIDQAYEASLDFSKASVWVCGCHF